MLRGLMIGGGVEPAGDAQQRVRNPARGKAQGRIISSAERAPARWTADGSRSPEVEAIRIPGRSLLQIIDFQQAIGHPDENQSGRKRGHERHVGPDRQKCRATKRNGVLPMPATLAMWRVHPNVGLKTAKGNREGTPRTPCGRRKRAGEGAASSGQVA